MSGPTADPVVLDHLEIHVDDIPSYCDFLVRLFRGGRYRVLDASGVSMYLTPRGNAFEIKPRAAGTPVTLSGVCLPCLRVADGRAHLAELGLEVDRVAENPDGEVLFFTDPEGVQWHLKSYARMDDYVNW